MSTGTSAGVAILHCFTTVLIWSLKFLIKKFATYLRTTKPCVYILKNGTWHATKLLLHLNACPTNKFIYWKERWPLCFHFSYSHNTRSISTTNPATIWKYRWYPWLLIVRAYTIYVITVASQHNQISCYPTTQIDTLCC